ncbi:MAG: hypothetical protein HC887_11555 [Desulfobacteraceae bacterium]|nr:hypothetical protein [Desulfobacteraceae bacterium]
MERAREMIRIQVNDQQIEVDRKSVEVMDARVAVERKKLEQRQEFGRAALEFEIDKLKIAKYAEVQIAAANAMSTFMNKAQMTIFGDPATLASMSSKFSSAMGIGQAIEGFYAGMNKDGDAGKAVRKILESAHSVIEGLAEHLKKNIG